jgi:hypothetical protein
LESLVVRIFGLEPFPHYAFKSSNMLATRLYISALTLCFLILVLANRGLGILEAVVVTCAIGYLILDCRSDLQELKSELSTLRDLEQHLSKLPHLNL